jgi:chromosome partitioning protein
MHPSCGSAISAVSIQPDTPRILAIANQKGGVGKTTTAINLATALAANGEQTLLIDLDPQGNASTGLGIARSDRATGSYRLLTGEVTLGEARRTTFIPNLELVTAEADLAGAEIELVGLDRREFRLRDALESLRSEAAGCSFVLIDCPPSLGLLTLNGLVAADAVLVPLQCEFYALEGITGLVRTIEMPEAFSAKRCMKPSSRATFASPRRPATASLCCCTTSVLLVPRHTSGWQAKC